MQQGHKKQVYNPYLPNYEYIPDGEPHVFGDRLYVFGSHDRFNGDWFCLNDYVCWSTPVNDLSDWRYEGVIYRKTQDPENPNGDKVMYAPDVARGPDGRFYLYYGLADAYQLGVAVCDTPAGPYTFYGYVRHTDGSLWGSRETDFMPFDPGILVDDDGRIYLYAGQGPMTPEQAAGDRIRRFRDSAYVVELEADMLTIKAGPKRLLPNCAESEGTGFENHEFFEANSIRKFEGKYYFIYSSVQCHELVYAMSDRPDEGFRYCGTLHSNGDIRKETFFPIPYEEEKPDKRIRNYIANNHGSIVEIAGHYYIFGHRHTNATMFSRQGVAEEILRREDGTFEQAEMTSCGLNGGPLRGTGTYSAAIACVLQSKDGAGYSTGAAQNSNHPMLTQEGADRESDPGQYIANMRDGALAGFRYFAFGRETPKTIQLCLRGNAHGIIKVYAGESDTEPLAEIPVALCNCGEWSSVCAVLQEKALNRAARKEKTALFFTFCGEGYTDLYSFTLA